MQIYVKKKTNKQKNPKMWHFHCKWSGFHCTVGENIQQGLLACLLNIVKPKAKENIKKI